MVTAIFGGERDPNTPVSVVGASRIGGEAVEQGMWVLFFFLLASLNFFIGVFNLLPLLPLDGGHIAVVWYERVRDWIRARRGKAAGGPVDYTKLSGDHDGAGARRRRGHAAHGDRGHRQPDPLAVVPRHGRVPARPWRDHTGRNAAHRDG